MGSKVDECSGEASSENAVSYSVDDSNPIRKSQTEHFISGSSSNISENVDWEASCRNNSDLLSATSENVSVFPKLEDFKCQGNDHKDHHQSCVTEGSDSKSIQFSLSIGDGKESSSFPFFGNPPLRQEKVSIGLFQNSSECLDVRNNFDGESNSKWQRPTIKEHSKELPDSACSLAALPSQSAGFSETPPDTGGHGIDRLNRGGNNLTHILIDKFPSYDPSLEVSQECLSPQLHGENVNSLLGEMISVNNHGDPREDGIEIIEKNEVGDNADMALSNVKESSLDSHSMDECDDSDLVEHDVKVCDICGDAGREDLLAICCRCIDGAEHTYCMRETLDKVPSGDWLCEECKFDVEIKGRAQEIVGIVDGSKKSDYSGPADPESKNVYKKFESRVSDVGKNKICIPATKTLGKRQSDDSQVASPAKRRAIEPNDGSANKSTSNGVPAISRNSSVKMDRLKTKTNQHSSSSSIAAPESANQYTSASRLQGTFVKSNSFNSLNWKSKVSLLDDVIPQKQRSAREAASFDRKEGISKSISKSMSFKTPNMGRPNVGESRVKMLSSKFSHLQDTKAFKHSKDRSIFERKNSFQSERLSVTNSGSLAAKNDRKVVSSGETNSLNSPRKFQSAKAVQSDRKSSLPLKSSSVATRRGLEPSVSQGEVNRHSNLIGISSTNGDNNVSKTNQDSFKVDTTSSKCFAEGSSCNANEGLLDGLSQQNESTDSGERDKDSLSSRSREGMDKDKLKVAIEAAMLRKPGICQKHRRPDQCNDVSAAHNMKFEMSACQVLLSDSSNRENVSLSSEMEEGKKITVGSSTSDFYEREALDDAKQISLIPCDDFSSKAEESPHFCQLEGLSLAIPDDDYIWKGVFEVQRVGRTVNLFDGIQAHLSASASRKVLEVVNKFDDKVLLIEVPRLKTWPAQFQENGVKEDNIAVFFFAKDHASYEKSYKGLLNNMMKNDVALKGNFDGFELMIFPSNQLPQKYQRWNTMFFMWGVFRGKKVNLQQAPGSDEQINAPQGVPMACMSSPVNISINMPIDSGVPTGSIGSVASETRTLGSTSLSSSEASRDGFDCRSSDILDDGPLRTDQVLSGSIQNMRPSPVLQSSIAKSCGAMVDISRDLRHSSISPEGVVSSDDKKEPIGVYVESAVRDCDLNKSQENPVNNHCDLNQQQLSSGSHEMGSAGEGSSVDEMNSRKHEASLNVELANETSPGNGNQVVDDKNTEVASELASLIEPGATEDIDLKEVRADKKQKTDCYDGLKEANGGRTSPLRDPVLHSDCHSLSNGVDEINTGRYFFPVLPEEEVGQVRRSMQSSSRVIDLEEDPFQEDTTPNLELALGGESRASPVLPFSVEKDDKKFAWRLASRPEQPATTKGRRREEEDVVSASLSLSLSFPFPDKEEETTAKKPSSGSEAGHVDTSLLLFGVDGLVENRLPGRNSAASYGPDRFR